MPRTRKLAALLLSLAALFAAVSAQAEPALWVVKGPHATVYLFGSVHALKQDQPWRSPKIDAAIQQSGSLWLEVPNIDDEQSLQPLILQLGLDPQHPLSTKLTKEQIARLDQIAKSVGLPAGEASLDPMKPWLAAVTLGVMPIMQAGFDPKSGVEYTLKPEFDKANKPVKGFETAEQQLHLFADMSDKTQVDYLASELDDYESSLRQLPQAHRRLVRRRRRHDGQDPLRRAPRQIPRPLPDTHRPSQRGIRIADPNPAQGDGTVFVAVGAGHLVGKDGVPALLEKQGYKVARQ